MGWGEKALENWEMRVLRVHDGKFPDDHPMYYYV